ncbi:uncharacterized protein [Solanum tuberosum]|uniref:uncharacterized protein n=1 Tax=Solanum tuberosum TaxID=4113 RepID=UPI00073A2D7A|nr:PREDICTED: uncharacterized protein LOC107060538 [Solanum tuberosum]
MARSKIMDQSSGSMRNCKQQGRMKWAIWCEAQPPEIDLKRRRILGVSQRRKEVGERDPDRERGEGQERNSFVLAASTNTEICATIQVLVPATNGDRSCRLLQLVDIGDESEHLAFWVSLSPPVLMLACLLPSRRLIVAHFWDLYLSH